MRYICKEIERAKEIVEDERRMQQGDIRGLEIYCKYFEGEVIERNYGLLLKKIHIYLEKKLQTKNYNDFSIFDLDIDDLIEKSKNIRGERLEKLLKEYLGYLEYHNNNN